MNGDSPVLGSNVLSRLSAIADADAPVLIQGERGCGKEVAARTIHRMSRRAAAPFIAIPCNAIPELLVDEELFGDEYGVADRREGYLEQAARGCLFLDEVTDLSLRAQAKLVRVLDRREFSRVGSVKPQPLQARVLAASCRDLEQLARDGMFRKDLLLCLGVMTVTVPPLRERIEEIPALANHFLGYYAGAFGKPVSAISPDAMAVLTACDWPGNVRELEQVIRDAVVLAEGDTLRPGDLPRIRSLGRNLN